MTRTVTPVAKIRLVLALVIGPFAAATVALADEQPQNIVVLYADDWRHDTLGCAGHPVVQTPRLDALARRMGRLT